MPNRIKKSKQNLYMMAVIASIQYVTLRINN